MEGKHVKNLKLQIKKQNLHAISKICPKPSIEICEVYIYHKSGVFNFHGIVHTLDVSNYRVFLKLHNICVKFNCAAFTWSYYTKKKENAIKIGIYKTNHRRILILQVLKYLAYET